jgi:hypothetical protein
MHPLEEDSAHAARRAVFGGGPIPEPREVRDLRDARHSRRRNTRRHSLKLWYRDTLTPVVVKADRLRISRAKIYTVWSQNVHYIRGRLHGHGVKV